MVYDLRPAGTCHCGAVQVDLQLSKNPDALRLRACQCDFCRPRGARTISDQGGTATIRVDRPEGLTRYRFGLRTADYLLCAACGTYIAAVQPDESPIGVVNVGGLAVPEFDGIEPKPVTYGGETVEARVARRRSYWMPVAFAYSSGERPTARTAGLRRSGVDDHPRPVSPLPTRLVLMGFLLVVGLMSARAEAAPDIKPSPITIGEFEPLPSDYMVTLPLARERGARILKCLATPNGRGACNLTGRPQ